MCCAWKVEGEMLAKRVDTLPEVSVGLQKQGSSKGLEKCFDCPNRRKENLKIERWKSVSSALYIRHRKGNPWKMPSSVQSLMITSR